MTILEIYYKLMEILLLLLYLILKMDKILISNFILNKIYIKILLLLKMLQKNNNQKF